MLHASNVVTNILPVATTKFNRSP